MSDALSSLRDVQKIPVGKAKVFVDGVARKMNHIIAAVLREAREEGVRDSGSDGSFRIG